MKLFIPLFETHARYLKQIQKHLFEQSKRLSNVLCLFACDLKFLCGVQ